MATTNNIGRSGTPGTPPPAPTGTTPAPAESSAPPPSRIRRHPSLQAKRSTIGAATPPKPPPAPSTQTAHEHAPAQLLNTIAQGL